MFAMVFVRFHDLCSSSSLFITSISFVCMVENNHGYIVEYC